MGEVTPNPIVSTKPLREFSMPLDLATIREAYQSGRIEPHHVAELLNEVERQRTENLGLLAEAELLRDRWASDRLKLDIAYNPMPFEACTQEDGSEKARVQGGIFAVLLRSLAADLDALDPEVAPNNRSYSLEISSMDGMRVEVVAIRSGGKSPREQKEDALAEVERLKAAHGFQEDRHAKCWDALCSIGEALDRAGYPVLIPERALKVGEQVDALINDVAQLRAAVRLEWGEITRPSGPKGPYAVSELTFCAWGTQKKILKIIYDNSVYGWDNGHVYFPNMTLNDVRTAVEAHVKALGLPCSVPAFPKLIGGAS